MIDICSIIARIVYIDRDKMFAKLIDHPQCAYIGAINTKGLNTSGGPQQLHI